MNIKIKMNFNILQINKTCIFTPIVESSRQVVRTGTTDESAVMSFFNSCIHACHDKFIFITSNKEKLKCVHQIKNNIFETLVEKNKSYDLIKEFIFYLIRDFYISLVSGTMNDNKNVRRLYEDLGLNNESNLAVYNLITEIIPFDTGFFKIMKNTNKKLPKYSMDSYIKTFKKETLKFLEYQDIFDGIDTDRINHITNKILRLIDSVIEIIDSEYNIPVQNDFVSDEIINATSEYFNCNIFFIDVNKKEPFVSPNFEIKDRKSIVLLSFNHKHYEIVGKLLENNRIQRDFLFQDDFIVNINNFINKRNNVLEEEVSKNDAEDTVVITDDGADSHNIEADAREENDETEQIVVDNDTKTDTNCEETGETVEQKIVDEE
jgi:hypothetical protein